MGRFETRELLAALAVVAVGVLALAVACQYPMGTVVRMGPGFVPLALSLLLIALGAVLALQSRGAAPVELGLRWRPAVLILGGVLAWALLVDRLGFLPATAVLASCCALAERAGSWRSALALSVGLGLFGYLIFIRGLKVPFALVARDLLPWI